MSLSPTTGNPPAVTYDQIEAWNKLANDVTAALSMGGEQGLELLKNIMSEWCEAVDDVNAARQICVDFADRGLRHEAIHWHAKGFFEVADRIDPDRPGWEAWEAALQERGLVTPRIDPELKEMANRIHEDLATQDLSGQSLADYLGQLRRNMLRRGHLGERLVILESIRGIDPASQAWQDMLSPIRRRRVDMIADEVRAAIGRRDFETLASLREEVASQDWGDDLPGVVTSLLDATAQCESLGEYRGRLSRSAALIVGRCDEARGQPFGSPGHAAAVQAADANRREYVEVRTALMQAVRNAATVPEAAALVAELGVKDAVRQLDAAIAEPVRWLDQQAEQARLHAVAADIQAAVLRHVETAPRKSSDREAFENSLKTWKRQSEAVREKARKSATRLPASLAGTIEASFRRLDDTQRQLEAHLDGLRKREKLIILAVVSGIGLVVLVLLGIIVVSVLRS